MEIDYNGAERVRANQLYDELDARKAIADVGAASVVMRALPYIRGNVGAVGYCMGGWLVYEAAARGLIDVGVSYYGGGIQNVLDLADEIDVPMQFHFGESDPHVPISLAHELRTRFAGRDAQIWTYPGTDHGFNCWERETYHQNSAALAHGRALIFLAEHQ
jgi:carboxymethylenebutenolidase